MNVDMYNIFKSFIDVMKVYDVKDFSADVSRGCLNFQVYNSSGDGCDCNH